MRRFVRLGCSRLLRRDTSPFLITGSCYPDHRACLLLAHCEIGGTGKIGRGRGIADMGGPAVGSTQSRLTQLGQWIAADDFPFLAYCGLNSTS
jgi:hypothetical protein